MDPFLGQIQLVAFNFAPRGWAFCNGQLLSIQQNSALFALLGTTYGGDGRSTFGLPDYRGKVSVGMSDANRQGEQGGRAQVAASKDSGVFTPATLVSNYIIALQGVFPSRD